MNKEEIEQKLNEILDTEKELIEDLVDGKLSYSISISILQTIIRDSYNFALELASKNVKMAVQPSDMEAWENVPKVINRQDLDDEESGCKENFWIEVDKQSILNLKL